MEMLKRAIKALDRIVNTAIYLLFAIPLAAWLLFHTDLGQRHMKEALGKYVFQTTGMHLETGTIAIGRQGLIFHNVVLKDDNEALLLEIGHTSVQMDSWIEFFKEKTAKGTLVFDQLALRGLPESFHMLKEMPLHLAAGFTLREDKAFHADFEALFGDRLPFHGTFLLSPELMIDGSVVHLPPTNLKMFNLRADFFQKNGAFAALFGLSGPLSSPEIQGEMSMVGAIYEIPAIGICLKNIEGKATIRGRKIEIERMTADDGKGGKIEGLGYFFADSAQQYPFVLNFLLNETLVVNHEDLQILSNGSLCLQGNSKEGVLSGELQASRGSFLLPDSSSSMVYSVDVQYANIPEGMQKREPSQQAGVPWPLFLDIKLHFPRTFSIQGGDLDSQWRGEVIIRGTGNAPLYYGELKVVDGSYSFNGAPFHIHRGMIAFDGDLDKKTTLYVTASRNLDRVKVDVIAKGPVTNPVISFRSNPPLPQREILSWLLFNRGTSEISPFQGAQLSESITNLSSGKQQGPDLLSKIRSTLKIDRLEFGADPHGDHESVNVQVGKYISDNVLISVIKSDVNRVGLEANLTDQIKLQAQVGDDSEGQLLLKWKKDY